MQAVRQTLSSFCQYAENLLLTGDQARCEEAGKRLVAMIGDPRYAGMENGIAAILEEYREGYKARFMRPSEARIIELGI